MSMERRNLVGEGLEIRENGKTTLAGYAARFHDPSGQRDRYELWPGSIGEFRLRHLTDAKQSRRRRLWGCSTILWITF